MKTGSYRAQFPLESALDLKQGLKALGSDLLVTCGPPEDIIAGMARGTSTCSVICTQEVTSEELTAEARVILSHMLSFIINRTERFMLS